MRVVGIDFGEKRIGVAAADDRTRIAIPVRTVEVRGDPVDDLVRIVEEERADVIVMGLPLSLTGAEGPQARRIRDVIEALITRVDIPVETWDERLTTAQAMRGNLAPAGKRKRGGKPGPAADPHRDAAAAAIMLQSFMDSQRPYE